MKHVHSNRILLLFITLILSTSAVAQVECRFVFSSTSLQKIPANNFMDWAFHLESWQGAEVRFNPYDPHAHPEVTLTGVIQSAELHRSLSNRHSFDRHLLLQIQTIDSDSIYQAHARVSRDGHISPISLNHNNQADIQLVAKSEHPLRPIALRILEGYERVKTYLTEFMKNKGHSIRWGQLKTGDEISFIYKKGALGGEYHYQVVSGVVKKVSGTFPFSRTLWIQKPFDSKIYEFSSKEVKDLFRYER